MTSDFEAVRIALAADGAKELGVGPADLELVAYEDGIASVRFGGACASCPATIPTMIARLEAALRQSAPGVEMVEAVL